MIRLLRGWLLLPCLLLSCAHVPERELSASIEIPSQWSASPEPETVDDDPWWRDLGGAPLGVLVEEALTNNYDLRVAVARVDAARAEARIAGADLFPTLGIGFDASRSQRNFIGFPIPGQGNDVLTTRSTVFGLNLGTTWELDLWGRLRAERKAAKTETEASVEDLRAAHLSLTGQTTKVWLSVLEAKQQVQLAESTVESYEETAQQIRDRYEHGLRPALDLRLALATLDNAQALLEARRVALDRAVRQLEILLGRYPAGRLDLADAFPEQVETIPAGLPSELLERRPDLRAGAARLRSADWRVASAKAALLPRLSLTASGGTSTEELSDLLDPDFKVWNLAANLAQPILQGGRLRAGVDLSKAQVQQALAGYQSAVLTAFSEVETALAAESILARREAELAESVNQYDRALSLAQSRYEFGLETFTTVLDTQRRLLESQTQLVSIRRQRLDNRVDLHLALGGGFPSPAPSQSPEARTRLEPAPAHGS